MIVQTCKYSGRVMGRWEDVTEAVNITGVDRLQLYKALRHGYAAMWCYWRRDYMEEKIVKPPKPGNVLVNCACGCGNSFMKFDNWGKERKFLSGHNNKLKHNVSKRQPQVTEQSLCEPL